MEAKKADFEKAKRKKHVLRTLAEFMALGFIYLVWLKITHLGIPCPIRLVTGYLCPGCGLTHLVLALLRGDLHAAFQANAFLMVIAPFALVYYIYRTLLYIEHGRREFSPAESVIFAILLVAAIAFGIWRNV